MQQHLLRRLWPIGGVLIIVVIWVACLIPNPPHLDFRWYDKVVHVLAFGFIMLWWAQLIKSFSARALLAAMLIAMGIAIEYVQGWTGWRSFDYADMVADGIGVLGGWALAYTPLGNILNRFQLMLAGR